MRVEEGRVEFWHESLTPEQHKGHMILQPELKLHVPIIPNHRPSLIDKDSPIYGLYSTSTFIHPYAHTPPSKIRGKPRLSV